MSNQPLTFYRLWCGRRRHSPWLPSREGAYRAGLASRVTFADPQHGTLHLGPLAWVEVGQRRYARSKTVTVGRLG